MYGLGEAATGVSKGMREYEDEVKLDAEKERVAGMQDRRLGMEEERLGMAKENQAANAEVRQAQLQKYRMDAEKEGAMQSIRLALMGDLRGAEDVFNQRGTKKLKSGTLKRSVDPKSGEPYFTGQYEDGGNFIMLEKMALAMVGRTGKGGKGGSSSGLLGKANIDNIYNSALNKIKERNAKEAEFDESKRLTDDEMRKMAWTDVQYFLENAFPGEYPGQPKQSAPAAERGPVGNDPLGIMGGQQPAPQEKKRGLEPLGQEDLDLLIKYNK